MKYDALFLQELLHALHIPAYRIMQTDTASYEMFFVKGKVETVRCVDTRDLEVSVYVDHDGKTGSSTVQIYPTRSVEEITADIRRALRRARLIFDQPYTLPEGGKEVYEDTPTDRSPAEVAADVADAVLTAQAPQGAEVCALEIFVTDTACRVINSRGVDKTQKKRTVMFEYIPACSGEEGSVELYQSDMRTAWDTAALREDVSRYMEDVAARLQAKLPQEPIHCPVILPVGEIAGLMQTLAFDMSYRAVYNHANLYEIGDDIQKDAAGERLTLTACAQATDSPRSAHFDVDGCALTDRVLLRDGVCVGRFGSHRFAEYLGEEATGELPCLHLAPGTMRAEQLLSEEHLACVAMSGLQVDLFNDYIGGEVRLAYWFDGERRIPLTGISISGKLSDVLRTVRLCSECACKDGYVGPSLMRLDGMTIY